MGNLRIWLLNLFVLGITLLPTSHSSPSHPHFQAKPKAKAKALAKPKAVSQSDFKVRGTNLGAWLLMEGWIIEDSGVFENIPNGDFTDGVNLAFKSVTTQKYLCADSGGGGFVVANCDEHCQWQKFRLWRLNETTFRFRVPFNQFVGLDGIQVVAAAENPEDSATFEIIRESEDSELVRIKASNGNYLQVKNEDSVTADVEVVSGWENNDPTLFNMTIVSHIDGDFQLQNGYGAEAAKVMQEHYNTFIVESDFEYMKEHGVNGVRIPVGWWTAKDPNPPFPFVSGSLAALDNAFSWAKKYGIKIILDLHAAPDSQNMMGHSATRDGSVEWGKTIESIQQTLEAIDFFAARYGQHESLYGVQLINEPHCPTVTLKTLEDYYRAGYSIVRKYNPTVYVIFAIRLSFMGDMPFQEELIPLAKSLYNAVIDIHFYSLYEMPFGMSAKENIDFIKYNRTRQLKEIVDMSGDARIYIGEWSCGWTVPNETPEDVKEFANAQIEAYDEATFGWTFWTWKNVQHNWSLKWLIENNYVNLLKN